MRLPPFHVKLHRLLKNLLLRRRKPVHEVLPVPILQEQRIHHRARPVRVIMRGIVQPRGLPEGPPPPQQLPRDRVLPVDVVHVDLAVVDEVHAAVRVALLGQGVAREEGAALQVHHQLPDEVRVGLREEEVRLDVGAVEAQHDVLADVGGRFRHQERHVLAALALPELHAVFPDLVQEERGQVSVLRDGQGG